MPVYFNRTDATLGRLIGVCTIVAALFLLGDGDILPAIIFVIAGGFLFAKSNPEYSALRDFGVKLVYLVLISLALAFVFL